MGDGCQEYRRDQEMLYKNGRLIRNLSLTRLPASRSSSVGPKGRLLIFHPKVNGGRGVSFDKNEKHGLKMHFKSF